MSHRTLFLLGMVVVLLCVLHIVIYNRGNPLRYWHFIASKGSDGEQYADLDKLGKLTAIIVSSVVVLWMAHDGKFDSTTLFVYLSFCGGIAGWSAYLRAKNGKLSTPTP